MTTFKLWCAPCIAEEHRRGSPDVKAWSVCERCHTVDDLYLITALDPLDERIHTAVIDFGVCSVLLIKRNGRKTLLKGLPHCERWLGRAVEEGVATSNSGTRVTVSFIGETFETEQDKIGKESDNG